MMLEAKQFLSSICDIDAAIKTSLDAFCNSSGELFVEYVENENICMTNGVLTSCSSNQSNGFGLRSFIGDKFSYIHSSQISPATVQRAVDSSKAAQSFYNDSIINNIDQPCHVCTHELYDSTRFINGESLKDKINYLNSIEDAIHSISSNVQTVSSRLISSWQVVLIAKSSGLVVGDIRPLVRLSTSVILQGANGAVESGSYSAGGRYGYDKLLTTENIELFSKESVEQAEIKFEARPAPAGELPVVLGNGWTGILLHEAIGHGLEADANRKGSSAFSNRVGEVVAVSGVTVVDDGTIPERRGSINVDDEGNTSSNTVLIESGKLVGYMYDEMNASLMNAKSTGSGRRESYKSYPLPRMTNTMMLSGDASQNDMIQSVKRGILAKSFADGQVDTTSGNFVFSASEAYMIEDGLISYPIKGAMLIGNGPEILKHVSMVGNDSCLDDGVGTCGKDGQWVPVGVGMPSIKLDKITVGGAQV